MVFHPRNIHRRPQIQLNKHSGKIAVSRQLFMLSAILLSHPAIKIQTDGKSEQENIVADCLLYPFNSPPSFAAALDSFQFR